MPNGQTPIFIKIPAKLLFSESPKSYGFMIDDAKSYVPKSQIEDVAIDKEAISFWCPDWLVEQKKLETYICTDYMPSLFWD